MRRQSSRCCSCCVSSWQKKDKSSEHTWRHIPQASLDHRLHNGLLYTGLDDFSGARERVGAGLNISCIRVGMLKYTINLSADAVSIPAALRLVPVLRLLRLVRSAVARPTSLHSVGRRQCLCFSCCSKISLVYRYIDAPSSSYAQPHSDTDQRPGRSPT
jgi:hypothetical protein